MHPSSQNLIPGRLATVHERIRAAALAAGRPASDILLLAVSKTRPAGDIRTAASAGQRAFAESYAREAVDKMAELADLDLEWHFVGPIQSNKTRPVAEHFDWIHSVDRLKTARRLNDQRPAELPPLQICLQVNISDEPAKAGATAAELPGLAAAVNELPRLRLRGLMAIPCRTDDPGAQRAAFAALRALQEQLVGKGLELDTLSMGMTGDLESAILEGATMVRVGTGIFGGRD